MLDSKYSDYDPVWAPDGSSIVFTSDRAGSADLFRVKPDGTSLERLTTDLAYDDQAAFSPDGKQLVFVSTRGGGTAKLWTMDLTTRRVDALTSEKGGDFRPSWSPDGKWIAFSSSRDHNAPFTHGRWERLQLADIYIIHPDHSGLKKIAESGGFCGSPKWMSDSQHVVAYCMTAEQTLGTRVANIAPGNDTKLVSIDIDTGVSTDLPAGPGVKINSSPVSGNEIGYVRKDKADPGGGIYYISGKRGPRGDIRTASWLPDGKRVVYRAFEKDGYGLRIMDLQTKGVATLTDAYDNFPLWSPRGDLIMFARLVDDAYEIHTIKPDGTGLKRLTFTHGNDAHMAWSPDGESIAFSSSRMGFKDEGVYTDAPQPYGELFVMRYDGTHVEQITDNQWEDGTPAWQPMAVRQPALQK